MDTIPDNNTNKNGTKDNLNESKNTNVRDTLLVLFGAVIAQIVGKDIFLTITLIIMVIFFHLFLKFSRRFFKYLFLMLSICCFIYSLIRVYPILFLEENKSLNTLDIKPYNQTKDSSQILNLQPASVSIISMSFGIDRDSNTNVAILIENSGETIAKTAIIQMTCMIDSVTCEKFHLFENNKFVFHDISPNEQRTILLPVTDKLNSKQLNDLGELLTSKKLHLYAFGKIIFIDEYNRVRSKQICSKYDYSLNSFADLIKCNVTYEKTTQTKNQTRN